MTTRKRLTIASPLIPLLVAGFAVSAGGCSTGYHPETASSGPHSGAAHHKPSYVIHATIEEGEMEEKTAPDHVVAKGDPPAVPPLHPWANPTMDSTPTSIEIDASLAQACNIPDAKAFFDTDSADLQADAQSALDALAECFKTGPMKGHRLAITGHADPQGSEAYNKELGWARAAAVAGHLEAAGLAAHEMEQESAGESEAHQEDPNMWPYDRKVVLDINVDPESAAAAAEAEAEAEAE